MCNEMYGCWEGVFLQSRYALDVGRERWDSVMISFSIHTSARGLESEQMNAPLAWGILAIVHLIPSRIFPKAP